jgi:hypothetical protein
VIALTSLSKALLLVPGVFGAIFGDETVDLEYQEYGTDTMESAVVLGREGTEDWISPVIYAWCWPLLGATWRDVYFCQQQKGSKK